MTTVQLTLEQLKTSPEYFKNFTAFSRFKFLHPKAQQIALDSINWALTEGIEHPTITETVTLVEEDQALGRVSVSHSDCRALDLRSKGFTPDQRTRFEAYLVEKYGDIGAITSKGEKKLVVWHDSGHGEHFHIQLNKTYALKAVIEKPANHTTV